MRRSQSISRVAKPRKKIVFAAEMSASAGRSQTIGFLRYINAFHRDWDVNLVQSRAAFTSDLLRSLTIDCLDGFVCAYPELPAVKTFLAHAALPTILLDPTDGDIHRKSRSTLSLKLDDYSIGSLGAKHFLSLGAFRAFGFVNDVRCENWTLQRAHAFTDVIEEAGFPVQVFTPNRNDRPSENRKRLACWLDELPTPAAIMAANDVNALQVFEACHDAGITIPDRIAILGVDNDDILCNSAHPPLSSISPDFEEEGFLSGKALDELMTRKTFRRKQRLCPAGTIIERESTRAIPPAVQLVDRAVAYIRGNATKGITVTDVVQHLGVSRRLADLRFRQLQGTSMHQEILDRRLEAAAAQIAKTDAPFARIASSCGFGSATRLTHLFKAHFGKTMGDWRKEHRGRGRG